MSPSKGLAAPMVACVRGSWEAVAGLARAILLCAWGAGAGSTSSAPPLGLGRSAGFCGGELGGAVATPHCLGAVAHQLTLFASKPVIKLSCGTVRGGKPKECACAGHWVSVWREAFGKQRLHSCRCCGARASIVPLPGLSNPWLPPLRAARFVSALSLLPLGWSWAGPSLLPHPGRSLQPGLLPFHPPGLLRASRHLQTQHSFCPRLCNSKQGESSLAKFEENFVIYPQCVECGINVLFQALKAKLENLPILWLSPGIKMSCLVATGSFMSSSQSGGSPGPPAWTRGAIVTPPGRQRWLPGGQVLGSGLLPSKGVDSLGPREGGFEGRFSVSLLAPSGPRIVVNYWPRI